MMFAKTPKNNHNIRGNNIVAQKRPCNRGGYLIKGFSCNNAQFALSDIRKIIYAVNLCSASSFFFSEKNRTGTYLNVCTLQTILSLRAHFDIKEHGI